MNNQSTLLTPKDSKRVADAIIKAINDGDLQRDIINVIGKKIEASICDGTHFVDAVREGIAESFKPAT